MLVISTEGAYDTLRTPISGATANRNVIAGLYVQNALSNNGKNTALQTQSTAVGGGGHFCDAKRIRKLRTS